MNDGALRAAWRVRQLDLMARLRPRYGDLLPEIERSIHEGYRFPWRIAECPGVASRAMVAGDLAAMRAILEACSTPEFLRAAAADVPERYRRPDGLVFPRFVATDFQRGFDAPSGRLLRNVPEAQSFPANMLLKPTKLAALRKFLPDVSEASFFLDSKFETFEAYRAWLRAFVLGAHGPEDAVVLEVRPMSQATVVDMLLWCRLLGAPLVDVLDLEPDPKTGELLYRSAVVFDGAAPRRVAFDRPRVARRILNRCIPPELDQLVEEGTLGFDEPRLRAIFQTSIERDAASFVVHPQDFFVISKATTIGVAALTPTLSLFEPALIERLDRAGVPVESGVLKPAYFAGGRGVQGVSSSLAREELVRECARIDALRKGAKSVLERLRNTWVWQPRYAPDPLLRTDVRGFEPPTPDDAGPVFQELRFMWAAEPRGPGLGPASWTPLVGLTRWSRIGFPANAGFQKTAFTGTQGLLIEPD